MKKYSFIIDVAKCENCNNCFLSCRDEHCGNEWPGYSLPQPLHGQRWMNIAGKKRVCIATMLRVSRPGRVALFIKGKMGLLSSIRRRPKDRKRLCRLAPLGPSGGTKRNRWRKNALFAPICLIRDGRNHVVFNPAPPVLLRSYLLKMKSWKKSS